MFLVTTLKRCEDLTLQTLFQSEVQIHDFHNHHTYRSISDWSLRKIQYRPTLHRPYRFTSPKDQLSLTQHRKCVAYMANVVRIGGGKASQAKGKQKSSSSSIGLPVSYPQDGQTGSYHRGPITQSELYHISGKGVHKIKHIIISVRVS